MPLKIVRNDITRCRTDAIVNAANSRLIAGGGVDGAIHRAASPRLQEALNQFDGCRPGQVVVTPGFELPVKYIIHTVGPRWFGGIRHEARTLAECYRSSLRKAEELGCESISFPLISTGVYGYPKKEALEIAVHEIEDFLQNSDMQVDLIVLDTNVTFLPKKLLRSLVAYISEREAQELEQCSQNRRELAGWSRRMESDSIDSGFMGSPLKNNEQNAAPQSAKPEAPSSSVLSRCDFPVMDSEEPEFTPDESIYPFWSESEEPSLEKILSQKKSGFSEYLLQLIDKKGMTDTACYRKANIDRKLFSKIRSNPDYHPKKGTVLSFALALELNLEETKDLLARAGYALSPSSKSDLIVEYFIQHGQPDVIAIDQALQYFGQPSLA